MRTSFTDHSSGGMSSASGGDFLIRRRRHVAAFLRTIGRTAPFVCTHDTPFTPPIFKILHRQH